MRGNMKVQNSISRRDFLRRQQIKNRKREVDPVGFPPTNNQQASIQPAEPEAGESAEVDNGQWSSSEPITYTYQWQLDGVDIVGATLKTISATAVMVGSALRCVVRATNRFGFSLSITAAVVVKLGV